MATYWLSFCDEGRPKGQQFLGVTLIDLDDAELNEREALVAVIKAAWAAQANPGGQIQSSRLTVEDMEPDAQQTFVNMPRGTLLSRAQLEAYGALDGRT